MDNKLYTQQELENAIKFACQEQKFQDYQLAGKCLIVDDSDLEQGIEDCLNGLINVDDTAKIDLQLAIK